MISKRNKLYQRGKMGEFKILRNKIVSEIRKEKHVTEIRFNAWLGAPAISISLIAYVMFVKL